MRVRTSISNDHTSVCMHPFCQDRYHDHDIAMYLFGGASTCVGTPLSMQRNPVLQRRKGCMRRRTVVWVKTLATRHVYAS